ncbi:phage tail tape measure protein [Paeniglutamicibacter gangotriensis]|uniref:Phage tail like protein n=1 Tax=Paeniglutamicibacter gangotriensis Lz1y TaxID=1276920 RepID=M7MTT3_9MICC|nr:phage tail tape measure protein [Paeniglutamicibacter gangotriensis]EMQ98340.1 phage tail like protein [Paeniglutamicibacter gangotriensis Lz1y]
MATRDVTVRIKAEIGSFKRDMLVAAGAARKAAAETEAASTKASSGIGKLGRVAGMHEQAWGQVSTGLVAGGVAAAGGVALVTKAAIDWESAWTGVKKTVDGTPKQLAEVEGGLRELARTLPSTHTEIAAVAEAAGQLGIKTGDVVSFTKTMIDLGETTNLSAEEAATGLARFSNIMGTSASDVDRLGSTLVGLGNNYATTESEILALSMRLSGAGRQVNLSEGEVMGLSAAMSSVGIEAEAGGSAMSLTMKRIGKAVDGGDEALSSFAETAGMSADQFSTMWKDDAAGALEAFVGGLGAAGEQGESVNGILTELGITGIRESDALLRLSASAGIMGDAMAQGNKEFETNNALLEEADKRYSTTESKIKAALSSIQDSAITFGGVMLPVVAGVSEGVAGIATAFSKIPAPIAGALTVITGFLGVGALVAGVGMKMVGSFTSTVGGLKALGLEFPGLTGKMEKFGNAAPGVAKKFAKFAGAAVAIGAVTVAVAKLAEASYMSKIDEGMGRVDRAMAKIIHNAPDASDALDGLFKNKAGEGLTSDIDSLGSAIDRTFNKTAGQKFNDWGENLVTSTIGVKGSLAITEEAFGRIDQSLADLVGSGNVEGAKTAFDGIAEKFVEQGRTVEEAKAMFPGYADALAGVAAEAANAGGGLEALGGAAEGVASGVGAAFAPSKEMAEALEEIGVAADGSVASLGAFTDYLFNSGLAMMSSKDAAFQWAKGLRDMDGEIKKITDSQGKMGAVLNKGKDDFNASTDAGYAGLQLFQGKLQEGIAVAQTYAADTSKSQKDVVAQYQATYDAGIKTAEGFGIMGEKADALVRSTMGIPDDVSIKTWIEDEATAAAERITGQLLEIPKDLQIKVMVTDDGTTNLTKEQIAAIKGQTVGIEVTDEGTVLTTQGAINGVTDGDAKILVSDDGTITVVQGGINNVKDGAANVNVTDNGTVSWVQGLINSISGKSVTINTHYTKSGAVGGQSGPGAKATPGRDAAKARGGRAPGLADGGRVPRTGLGTDKVMGINSDGIPHVWVDDREWVINRRSSDKHDDLLNAINRDDPRVDQLKGLAGLAGGGRAGSYTVKRGDTLSGIARQFGTTWRELQRINKIQNEDLIYAGQTIDLPGGASKAKAKPAPARSYSTSRTGWAEKERDQDAREVKAATAELTAAKRTKNDKKIAAAEKNLDKAKKSYDDSKERVVRLREKEFDLRRDLKRGNIVDAFTSGSGMSVVDQLFDQSNNKDLSKKQRATLRSTAYSMESQLLKLEKQSDKLSVSLGKAADKRDDLLSARNGVRDSMVGAFDLGGLAGQKDAYGYDTSVGKKGLLNYGKSMASGAKKLSSKVAALQKAGFHPSMIEQVISEWTSSGTFELADAMLSMNKSERSSFNSSFKSVERYGLSTGTSLTNAMAKGGINAAEGLVKGLTSQQKKVDNAFYKLGKDAEKSFKRSLGIKSPSTVMFGAGVNVGEGAELGILSKVSDVQGAMGLLAEAPAFAVPPSAEVARYAAQPPASAGVVIDYDRLAQAMTSVQLNANLQIDRKQAGTLVQAGQKFNGNH